MLKAIALASLFALPLLALSSCQRDGDVNDGSIPATIAKEEQPAASPSGRYVLNVVALDKNLPLNLSFFITDREEVQLFTSEKSFDSRSMTYFLWDEKYRVWVYSGDTGTYFWERSTSDNDWQMSVYARSNVAAPQFLKDVRSKYHPR